MVLCETRAALATDSWLAPAISRASLDLASEVSRILQSGSSSGSIEAAFRRWHLPMMEDGHLRGA